MSEILSAVRLKERILIIVITLALALLVGGSAGAVTYATTDRHEHDYKYTLEMSESGEFSLVGVCGYEKCSDPHWSGSIDKSFITTKVTKDPTCCEEGVKTYSFTWADNYVTYVRNESIPTLPHTYIGRVDFADNGTASVNGICTNPGCTNTGFSVSGVTEVELVETTPATCNSSRIDKYVIKHNGQTIDFTTITEESIEHKLNGTNVSEFLLDEGIYKFGTEGMTPIYSTDIGCGQITSARYTCDECKQEFTVKVGKPEHVLVYDAAANILPTLEADGRAVVNCTNEGCDHSIYVTLPQAVEGVNTVEVGNNHNLEERYLKYTFSSEEHGINIELDFTLDWINHSFTLDDNRTVYPTFGSAGVAYVSCTFDGCDKEVVIDLPVIVIDTNATVVSPATEKTPQRFKYSYTNDEYNFTIEFENFMGDKLSHNYVYELVASEDDFNPIFVGKCGQLECDDPIVYFPDKQLDMKEVDATCTEFAYLEFSCEHEGETYYYRMYIPFSGYAHQYELATEETVYPTTEQVGKATLRCTLCGASEDIELPVVEVNEGADNYVYDPETNTEIVTYLYVYEYRDQSFVVEHIFIRVKPHTHEYEYSLAPSQGAFGLDFIGICTITGCSEVYCESDVDAVLINDTSTCTEPGVQTYEYIKDGISQHCDIIVAFAVGHSFTDYDINASTTLLPTLDAVGHITVKCSACGAHGGIIELPKAVIGEGGNAVLQLELDSEEQDLYRYTCTVVFEGNEITVSALILLPKQNTLAE